MAGIKVSIESPFFKKILPPNLLSAEWYYPFRFLAHKSNGLPCGCGHHYVKRAETQYLVTFVEIGLMALGYYNSSVEAPGVFGGGLETAVRNFQSAHGLVCDGIAGKGTILKILACLGC